MQIKNVKNIKTQAGKSRYEEDIFPGDHSTVWGSWWNEELGWGFGCCHQTEKTTTCLGEKGKKMALVKEFRIKKAKQEQLFSFAKNADVHDDLNDQALEEKDSGTEKALLEQLPPQEVAPPQEIKVVQPEKILSASKESKPLESDLQKRETKDEDKRKTETNKPSKI